MSVRSERSIPIAGEMASPGVTLADRYFVERMIGQGTFGRVFRAYDRVTDTRVALKEFLRQPGRADGFLREVGILFDLHHPSIIRCHSLVASGAFRYIVCELMEAGSLRGRLATPHYDMVEALRFLKQAASGVAFAHSRNIVHRDLKPENVLLSMVGGEVVAKVSDFGISTMGTALGEKSCIGSPAYMAPEQFHDRYDARVDVYALGVMLFEIICGQRPFQGTPAHLMVSHLRHEPEYPTWIPTPILRVLRKALAKKPEKRFPSVDDFLLALELALDGGTVDRLADAFPLAVGAVDALALTPADVLVRRGDRVARHDARGHLVETVDRATEMLAAGGFHLIAHEQGVTVRGPLSTRVLPALPRGALVALSAEGAVAFASSEVVNVVESGNRYGLGASTRGEVTAIAFAGAEQTLAIARRAGSGATIEMAGAVVALPEPIAALYGHPERYELVARSAVDPSRLYLVASTHAELTVLPSGPFSSDGESFFAVTPEGALATVNARSGRVARTGWESPLAAAAAAPARLAWVSKAGGMTCVNDWAFAETGGISPFSCSP